MRKRREKRVCWWRRAESVDCLIRHADGMRQAMDSFSLSWAGTGKNGWQNCEIWEDGSCARNARQWAFFVTLTASLFSILFPSFLKLHPKSKCTSFPTLTQWTNCISNNGLEWNIKPTDTQGRRMCVISLIFDSRADKSAFLKMTSTFLWTWLRKRRREQAAWVTSITKWREVRSHSLRQALASCLSFTFQLKYLQWQASHLFCLFKHNHPLAYEVWCYFKQGNTNVTSKTREVLHIWLQQTMTE